VNDSLSLSCHGMPVPGTRASTLLSTGRYCPTSEADTWELTAEPEDD